MRHDFPYTDLHELNLDWFLSRFKDMQKEYTEMVRVFENMIKTLDPDGLQKYAEFYFPKNPDKTTLQGDVCVIRSAEKTLMIDAWLESAYSHVKSLLVTAGVKHIDMFILSHYHLDHFGGMAGLVADGYIDKNTKVYLPADTALVRSNASLSANMATVKSLLGSIPYTVPSPGDTDSIGDIDITFYNCSPAMTDTDYNEQSTVCLLEVGGQKALFTGDCHGAALGRLMFEDGLTDHIDLYKIGHHGINAASNNRMAAFLDAIRPDIAVDLTTLAGSIGNTYHNGQQTGILQSQGAKLLPVHVQRDHIIKICMSAVNTWIESGRTAESVSSQRLIKHVYVDPARAGLLQTGDPDYPYASIAQAVGACDFHASTDYRIHAAPGVYGQEHATPGKNLIPLYNAHVSIDRWGDSGTVTIYNGISAINSYIRLLNVTMMSYTEVDPEYESEGVITCNNCHVLAENCIFNGNTVYVYRDSQLRIDSCSITGAGIGLHADHSNAYAINTAFTDCTTAFQITGGSSLTEYGSTYTGVTTQKIIRPGSIDLSSLVTTI